MFVSCVCLWACAPQSSGSESPTVDFPDHNLEAALCDWLRVKPPVLEADMERLEVLYLDCPNIERLDGLEHAHNLRALRLYNCQVSELDPLQALSRIEELAIRNSPITDARPLSQMPTLKCVIMEYSNLTDLEWVRTLPRLKWLSVRSNDISVMEPLTALSGLQYVDIRDNPGCNSSATESVVKKLTETASNIRYIGDEDQIGRTIADIVNARSDIAEYSVSAEFPVRFAGGRPEMLEPPRQVSDALECLVNTDDTDWHTDIAVFLCRYATKMCQTVRPWSVIMDSDHLLLRTFLDALRPELPGDEVLSGALVNWVFDHSSQLMPSVALADEVDSYRACHSRRVLESEWGLPRKSRQ